MESIKDDCSFPTYESKECWSIVLLPRGSIFSSTNSCVAISRFSDDIVGVKGFVEIFDGETE